MIHKQTYLLLLFSLFAVAPQSVNADVVYDWTGPCSSGCVGNATAVITLTDAYAPGNVVSQFDAALFVSLEYSSSSGSFTITGNTLNTNFLFTIDPSIGADSQVTDGLSTWFLDADRVGGGRQWAVSFPNGTRDLGPIDSAGSFTIRTANGGTQTYVGKATFPDVSYSETFFPSDPDTGSQIEVTCDGTSSINFSDMVVTVSPPTMRFTVNTSRQGVTGSDPRFCIDGDWSFHFQVANVTATDSGVTGQNNAGTLFIDLLFNSEGTELLGTANNTDGLDGQQLGQASLTETSTKLVVDSAGQLIGATDVDVNGSLYSVSFTKGNCINEFDGCDTVADFDFDNQADAEAAAKALANTVFVGAFDTNPLLQDGCDNSEGCGIFTPFGFFGDEPNVNLVVAQFLNYPNEADDEVRGSQTRVLDIELNFAQTWARWDQQDQTLPDDDGDGVNGDIDLCPDTLLGDPVDANGCTIDDAVSQIVANLFVLIDGPVSDKARDNLGKAQDKLNDALAELGQGDVKKGLKKIGDSVKELLKAEAEGVDVVDLIDQLLEAAQSQAQSAIDQAIAAGGDSEKIAKAQEEMVKADEELAKGKPDKAIDKYAEAWGEAQKAQK